MYNAQLPKDNELPSSRQLLVSTLMAIALAVVILLVAILPAEYAIDPTGIGEHLGLTEMGEIKAQLAEELMVAEAEAAPVALTNVFTEVEVEVEVEKVVEEPVVPAPVEEVIPSETVAVTLAPGEAAEIKLVMARGDTVDYSWSVDAGHLNYDTHGDNPATSYHGYNKGKAVKGDQGQLTAAFDGKHGWFWRNRSAEVVTVTLEVEGQFEAVKRVL